tara:strand:- start:21 stop:467 length:447 start_codon:yes stop_codon:yes gene_type:complete
MAHKMNGGKPHGGRAYDSNFSAFQKKGLISPVHKNGGEEKTKTYKMPENLPEFEVTTSSDKPTTTTSKETKLPKGKTQHIKTAGGNVMELSEHKKLYGAATGAYRTAYQAALKDNPKLKKREFNIGAGKDLAKNIASLSIHGHKPFMQ